MSKLLSQPHPVRVITDKEGRPVALIWQHKREPVVVCNHWRQEGNWWRQPIAREYYRLLTRSGSICIVYQDATRKDAWYLAQVLD